MMATGLPSGTVEQGVERLDGRDLGMKSRIGRHDADELGAHGNARLKRREGEPGLALAMRPSRIELAAIDQRLGTAMGLGKGGGQLPVVANGMNLGGETMSMAVLTICPDQ